MYWRIGFSLYLAMLAVTSSASAIPLQKTTDDTSRQVTIASASDPSVASPVFNGSTRTKQNPFEPSAEIRPMVDFWKKIYTQYTTRQVVIHDKDDLTIIYEVVDLDSGGKKPARERKRKIEAALKRLSKNGGVPTCPEEEEIAAKLAHIQDSNKFSNAIDALRVQLGQADRFKLGLQRSGRYMNHIREVFRSYDLPEELTALPHVESSFNYKAYSSVGAAGIWQFMRGTGRLFMRVDYTVDERRDPITSTDAAARLLSISYNQLGSWPLAITSYNHGINGMRRAKELHGDDMATIIQNYKSRSFGFASRNFYTEFLAALDVSKNHNKYFTNVEPEPEYRFKEIVLPQSATATSLATMTKVPLESLKEHNLSLRPVVWTGKRPIPAGYKLRVPFDTTEPRLSLAEARTSSDTRPAPTIARRPTDLRIAPASFIRKPKDTDTAPVASLEPASEEDSVARSGEVSALEPKELPDFHYVKSGETLFSISKKYGTTVAKLASLNGLDKRLRIRPGQKLALESANEEVESETPGEPSAAEEPSSQELTAAAIEISPDQETPPASEPSASEITPSTARNSEVAMADDGLIVNINGRILKLDSSVFAVRKIRPGVGEIKASGDETVGHYAEWLKVSRKRIARMNGKGVSRTIKSGGMVKIPLLGKTASRKSFERNRLEYRMGMIEDFFNEYQVDGEKTLTVEKRGSLRDVASGGPDTPPLWLVALYNPDKQSKVLKPGDTVTAPVIVKKQ
ncbi:MAG: transglycosylase SLT domain-containing protein [Nitrospinae bacterium]|nr:transglycosylase SLT domain-containing protein [Nitrospinota bacterium]